MPARGPLQILEQRITNCGLCPRLREHCRRVGIEKRRAYLDWDYWAKPVPSFGDPAARLLIIGLAPGAHGANRTGRMFTGDSSGDFLYRTLYDTGFASQPESRSREDGLVLRDCYITASAHCAPPDNKPALEEIRNCRPYLEKELQLLPEVRVVVALGRVAFANYLTILGERISRFPFRHGAEFALDPALIASFHPSQQNTSTGRLTRPMFHAVFERARELLSRPRRAS